MEIGLLILGWTVYFSLHSLLANDRVKKAAKRVMGGSYVRYRLLYVFISVVGLLYLLYLNSNIVSPDLLNSQGAIRYLSLVFAAIGVIIIKGSFRSYPFSSFIGTREEGEPVLIKSGLLKTVRHPIYSGTVLIVIGYLLFSPNLPTVVSSLCIFIYLPIGMYLEEKKLIKVFGEQYAEYRNNVPALFPRLF